MSQGRAWAGDCLAPGACPPLRACELAPSPIPCDWGTCSCGVWGGPRAAAIIERDAAGSRMALSCHAMRAEWRDGGRQVQGKGATVAAAPDI